MRQPPRLYLQDVAVRDGFQIEPVFIPTARKIDLIDRLSRTGLAKIEVTSFTSPRAIPALADAEQVMQGITRQPGVEYTVLVPNLRGAERALACQADELNLVMSVSETHNLTNLRMTCEQSARQLADVARFAEPFKVPINVSLSCSFGCPMQGTVEIATVLDWSARFLDLGVRGITLCDTTGMAWPNQVADLVDAWRDRFGQAQLTLHFHNTRGMGLANVLMAVQHGVDRFDASLGGLGGCPYAPGATGNICTEDTVHMLEGMGFDTGVDLTALLECSRLLPAIVGHDISGQVVKAGRSLDLHPVPPEFDDIVARAQARD